MKTQIKNNALVISMDNVKVGWEQSFLLSSDEHFDSKHCNREKLKNDWDIAKKNNYPIINVGDFLDVMGKKYDPRSNMLDIRKEYKESESRDMYLDLVAKDAANFIKNYPVIMMAEGNHEYQIRRRAEFDIMKMIVYPLDRRPHLMPYEGFIRFQFKATKTRQYCLDMFYTHGTGGNAKVTKGAIDSQRRQHDINADIFVSGHIHSRWEIPRVKRYLDKQCYEKTKESLHISLGTYKEGRDTYAAMKGYGSPDIGGRKLTFYCDKTDHISYEVTNVR